MANGVLTLNARFTTGPKTLEIPITLIQTIEFNSLIVNPHAPPKILGIGPDKSQGDISSQADTSDLIVLRGDDRRECKLLSIDADRIHCDVKDNKGSSNSFGRGVVLRIQVGVK
jgi:hypothetical protein